MGSYASVNGLEMYYEIHGTGRPLLPLHGAFMTIDAMGEMVPALARTRQVTAVELQAHGHTADIDHPLSYEQMADGIAALLRHIGIEAADIFGYSMGGGVALQVAIRHPEMVRKLVVASVTYNSDGIYPEVLAGKEAYARIAPNPEDWPTLIAKVKQLDGEIQDWPPEDIRSIKAPTLVMIADSDVVRPEHAVEMFRLLGGGVAGDLAGLPKSQLAVLPGTTHVTLVNRVDWLLSMTEAILDAPMSEAE